MKSKNFMISVVVPCYNEVENIPIIIASLQEAMKNYCYEIILVDDGSTDNSSLVYEEICQVNSNIHYIRLSRNFGHQAALMAGINYSKGDAVITIDADLQQPPSLIPEMVKQWLDGAEIVDTIPIHLNSVSWFKKYSSYLFYTLLDKLTDSPVVKSANDFRLIDRKVADILKTLPENHLYLSGLFSWMGFKHQTVKYRHLKRINGETHYPLGKMIKLAVSGITSMSIKPLRLALVMGTIVSGIAFIIILWALYLAIFTERAIAGWTSMIVSTVFLSGIQLLVLGILGEYIGRLFIENKRRPAYIISNTNIGDDTNIEVSQNSYFKERRHLP